jgi:curved DNA-binding protein CbpA
MDFFNLCKDKDEAKKIYRQLCKQFHPDKGGDPELLKELIRQYEKFQPNASSGFQYRQSAYGSAGYQFNKINRNGNIHHDHPIHEEIRSLKTNIKDLNLFIDRQKNFYESSMVDTQLNHVADISQLKAEFDIKISEMNLLDFLKKKWELS